MSHHYRSYPMILLAGLIFFILMLGLAGCVENMNSAGKPKNSANITTPETEFVVSDSWSFKQQDKEDSFDVPNKAQAPRPSSSDSPGLNLRSHFNFDALDKESTGDESDISETAETQEESDVSSDKSDTPYFNDAGITDAENSDSNDVEINTSDEPDFSTREPAAPTITPTMMTYSTMEYGYSFDYPVSWKKLQDEGEKVVFSIEKIVDENTIGIPDKAVVTVTYFDAPQKEGFEEWFSAFPIGSEKVTVKAENLLLVDLDTEGPFGRDYFRKIGKSGALKMSIVFEPGYNIELETESAGWKNYLDASENFRKEVFQEYLEMILSVVEDV